MEAVTVRLIAASALAENISIHTCKPDDLVGIEGLEVRTVPHRTNNRAD